MWRGVMRRVPRQAREPQRPGCAAELTGHQTSLLRGGLAEILPVVLACLVTWAIEVKASRQAS
jgi:hypothetical protein